MGKEFELKYAASAETLEKIAAVLADGTVWQMATTYYDTPSGALKARKWTLRVRRENENTVVTVKTPAAGGGRGEWECHGTDPGTAAPQLVALGAPAALVGLLREGVAPVCGAAFTRRAIPVQLGDTLVEVALDQGKLFREGREMPLCELEVELKQGSETACIAFAEDLAKRYGLAPEPRSKFARAVSL